MISAELWGILILAAQNQVTLTREQLAELTGSDSTTLNYELGRVASRCVSLHLPPLHLVVEPQTLEAVWKHDWTSQEVPERDGVAHSIFSALDIRRGSEAAKEAAQDLIDRQWPAVARLFKEKVGPATVNFLTDDERIEYFAEVAYSFLPTAVRLLVREKQFVKFCVAHKDKVLSLFKAKEAL